MIIERPLYARKYKQAIKQPHTIIITWQRRSGKSVLLSQITKQYQKKLYIDMENYENRKFLDIDVLYSYIKEKIDTDQIQLCAIDEIQYIKNWESVLLSLSKYATQVTFVITGSNSDMISSELATRLRGKSTQIHILPFGYQEFLSYHNMWVSQSSWTEYMTAGSFAYAYSLETLDQKKDRIQQLINTIFLKDIVERHKIRNPELLRQLFLFVLENTGSITNIKNIKNSLKQQQIYVTVDTLQQYMSYLIDSYLVYPVDIYDIQGKKVFDRMRKYYPSDHIWRQILMWWFDPGQWKTLETMVYFELLRYGWSVQVGRNKKTEVDFVATRNDHKIYLQVSYLLQNQQTLDRELTSLTKISDNYPKYIVSLDPLPMWEQDGIKHIQVRELGKVIE